MTYKTILVLCDASASAAARIAYGHQLARANDAHLIGLHICPLFVPPVTLGAGFSMVGHFRDYDERVKTGVERTRAVFDKIVAGSTAKREWRVASRSTVGEALEQARCTDLVVMGQEGLDRSGDGGPVALPASMIMWSGRPVLIVPLASAPSASVGTIILCWDATRAAALAASASLPLLKAAAKVEVLIAEAREGYFMSGGARTADPTHWLARHGVTATVRRRSSSGREVGEDILRHASDMAANLIVMGAYGHSRMRQAVLGGVSRTLLTETTVPILMAH